MSSEPGTDQHDGEEPPPGSGIGWMIAAIVAVIAAICSIAVLGWLLFGGALSGSSARGGDVRACIIDPTTRDFTKDGEAKRDEQPEHERPDGCPPEGSKMSDGLVERTNAGGFTMRELVDGRPGEVVELFVREPDRPYIDIAHASTHAALGQPIRVYTLEIDGKRSVVYMEDAPLLR